MAKITFSGLVSRVTGKLGGDVIREGRSGSVLMDGYKPSRKSNRQAKQRKHISDYTGQWYSLTAGQKELWHKYASLLDGAATGMNVYVGYNVRLLMANHADLTGISTPPSVPSTPEHLQGMTYSRDEDGDLTVTWTRPDDVSTYVCVYYCYNVGYSTTGKEGWHYIGTAKSDALTFTSACDVSLDRTLQVKVCSLDAYGRQSPFVYGVASYVPLIEYVYIVASVDNALTVFDISDIENGNITHKAAITGAGVPNYLGGARRAFVSGDYAYVTAYSNDALTVFDISDIANGNITHKAVIMDAGAPNYLNGAQGVFVSGNYAYVAAYFDNALTVFDISDIANGNITHKAAITGIGAPNYLYRAVNVVISGDYAYVASFGNNALTVFDISDIENGNITHKAAITGAGAPNYLGGAWGVFISGDYAYVAAYSNDALTVFDISDIANGNITHKAAVTGAGFPYYLNGPRNVYVSGNYAYVANYLDLSLTVFDISDVANGNITYKCHAQGQGSPLYLDRPVSVFVSGDYAYVAVYVDEALTVFDISDVANGNITHKAAITGAGAPNYLGGAWGVFVG